ncbi:N-acetyltransferase [Vitiosangium sp. GDMCC 1.1324]|uniref:GNAT family N-acetyltransferase n=1 Tax=Vitiosangium sp. (strain GDMCC 1.1324) TaxID=2138576 RepID=UPI00130D66F2|nr:GNAT family N-acetyltransferase [Vitiosangium sp. GDMCC 1.1324]
MKRLGADDALALQALLERCRDFLELTHEAPRPGAAREFLNNLPNGKTLEDKFVLGLYAEGADELAGVIDIVRHWPIRDEWIIGTFLLEPTRRNTGLGASVHRDLEQWVRGQGATGLRLVVQVQNPAGLRFWQRQGYAITGQTVQRTHVRENIIHLLRKPLDT